MLLAATLTFASGDRPAAPPTAVVAKKASPGTGIRDGSPALLFVGSTMTGGAANAWYREGLIDRRDRDQAARAARADAPATTPRSLLTGMGMVAASVALSLVAGEAGGPGPGREVRHGDARKGGGAAIVWKMRF